MIIVGEQLSNLNRQLGIVDRGLQSPADNFSINLSLENQFIGYLPNAIEVIYGSDLPQSVIVNKKPSDSFVTLEPKEAVLGCSIEKVTMPKGYFGLLQTKGSLARLFITATCCDGQIEPGYSGKITFELVNFGLLKVKIPIGSPVVQMYIFKCSSTSTPVYEGRYQLSNQPTTSRSERGGKINRSDEKKKKRR